MNLRKQIFTAFLIVAVLPLIIVSLYLFGTNIGLAFELYRQDLYNSTQIQANLLEENINRLMVRTGNLADTSAVREACSVSTELSIANNNELTTQIVKFTDETLDTVAIFALRGKDGSIRYASGSNSDSQLLQGYIDTIAQTEEQYIFEMPMGEKRYNLGIYTPVKDGDTVIGSVLVICKTDFFLKTISNHKQIGTSNALIYCTTHNSLQVSKQDIKLERIEDKFSEQHGSILTKMGGKWTYAYYRNIAKTPWILINCISVQEIFAKVWNYGIVNIIVLLLFVVIILILSRKHSKKILLPLEDLLDAVEKFFLTEADRFPLLEVDPKTEIGYLASKFTGMSDKIAMAQSKLRESNYLYNTLLEANYELRIVVDLRENKLMCSSDVLEKWFLEENDKSVQERVAEFFATEEDDTKYETIYDIVSGKKSEPEEIEVCCDLLGNNQIYWYHMISVPIADNENRVQRVVLHLEDITEQKKEEIRLIQVSQTDALCGIYNKNTFFSKCNILDKCVNDAVFFIDLDQFKLINDTLGHAAGDEVLRSASKIIQLQFRNSDVVGRYGGDEFVVFASAMNEEQARLRAAMLVENLVFERAIPQGGLLQVSVSVGVYIIKKHITIEQAVKYADEAMYQAKQNGKSQYYIIE